MGSWPAPARDCSAGDPAAGTPTGCARVVPADRTEQGRAFWGGSFSDPHGNAFGLWQEHASAPAG